MSFILADSGEDVIKHAMKRQPEPEELDLAFAGSAAFPDG